MDNLTSINPASVPFFTTYTGAKVPSIGFGTFGSDHVSPTQMAEAVRQAIMLGYRHIDCAAVYGNEREIGVVLRELYAAGVVQREELWLTSKVWNDHHGDGDVLLSCAKSLKDLGTDYLDLMLIHWPFPNFHPPRCTVASRSPDAKPYIHDDFMRVYRQLERLADMGLTRHIGISNVTIPKLKLIIRDCRIKPAVNEMELHPHLQQPELFEFSQQLGILNIGYCPLGSPNRPERDKTPNDTVDMDDQVIVKIAQDHKVHPAAICLKWAVQRGNAAIPMSANPKNIRANLAAVCSDPLTAAEMSAINQIDRQCRLVKGHVFLWNSAKDWNDLWDIDGFITQ
jgi:alcohol dehydrogenase (NADP+)